MRQQVVARIARSDFHHLASRAELFHVFLQDNLHGVLFSSQFAGGTAVVARPGPTGTRALPILALQFGGEGQQRDVARAFDRFAEPPLVARACTRHTARQNLASLLYERLEHLDLLVVDEVHALNAEPANLLLAEILALAATARAARSATWAAGTAAIAALTSPSATGLAFSVRSTAD